MARKRYRKKRRSCGVCKPHKAGIVIRWSGRDFSRLRSFEKAKDRGLDWFDV